MSKYLKSGDIVKIITGNDKGKTGKIIFFDRLNNQVKVEGINIQTHFNKNNRSGITKREGWINVSNVMLFHEDKTIRLSRSQNILIRGDKK